MSLSLVDRAVVFRDLPLLGGLAPEIRAEADPRDHGLFLLAEASETSSRLLFGAGSIPRLERFSVCHRYEPFWMKPCAGTRLSQVPHETQSLLAELTDGTWLLLVPLLGDLFRFSLKGKADDTLVLVGETGDSKAYGAGGLALYVATGDDPFELVRLGAESVMARLGTGKLRHEKSVPDFVDQFGWCTWDAFYQEVSAEKVCDGLRGFAAGGVSPRFLILDDGWQSIVRRPTGEKRLTGFSANDKFPDDLRPLVRAAKDEHGVRTFLVWHAVVGYWGGVDGDRLPGYDVIDQTRQFGEGILFHTPLFNQDWWGSLFGLVPAEHVGRFYDDYHASLREQGVDGIKVDSQSVIEALAQGQGGRVALTRAYRDGLEASAARHFDGRLINCMSNGQETWYGSSRSTLLRSSIDFFPKFPESHGLHVYTNAQVGLWFGQFMHPDWDMFQSGHEWGAYHAAARAISGGPVYVSDKPGEHDFALMRKLVCSDGNVLRCDVPALPTLDVICHDPTREDVLMKIWSRNGAAGVVGAFNARVGGDGKPGPTIGGTIGPSDVPGLTGERVACFFHQAGSLEALGSGGHRAIQLGERGWEICTLVPIERGFAAIGLSDKLNSAGAVARVDRAADGAVAVELRDGGAFLAYCENRPAQVEITGREGSGRLVPFEHDAVARTLRLDDPATGRHSLVITW